MKVNKIRKQDDTLGIGYGPDWAGVKVDTTDLVLQYNPDGTMRTVVDLSTAQTITGDKTFTGTVVMSGAVTKTEFADGTAAAPSITFSDDLDSGIYRIGANNIGVALNGAIELNLTTTAFSPGASDGSALGTTALMWSDLFLASTGVINFDNGDVTITHASNSLAFAGATAGATNGYSFDVAVGTIASEHHAVDVTSTGTLASGKGMVGVNAVTTAAGTAGAWLSAGYFKTVQASKMVNGYLCAAEFELASTAANASDNSVIVLNSTSNHSGSPPACTPYITLREYGTTAANVLFRVFGDSGQGSTSVTATGTIVSQTTGAFEANANCTIRCMVGSTPVWLIATTVQPS